MKILVVTDLVLRCLCDLGLRLRAQCLCFTEQLFREGFVILVDVGWCFSN